jgi:hypothetical protein
MSAPKKNQSGQTSYWVLQRIPVSFPSFFAFCDSNIITGF